MAVLTAGKKAPAILLASTNGQKMSLAEALKKGPVLAAFFKVSCPVCQFTFPFLERMYESYGDAKFTYWGVSQNDAADTREFTQELGVKFPMLLDDEGFAASNQYGLTNVPSLFLISPDGKVQVSSVGFAKADLEMIAAEAARAAGKPTTPLFKPGEVVPDYKPG
ncbi:MAG: TlpA disulfide reductase family protein [Candidatus Acidiferrales bacterium]